MFATSWVREMNR